MVDFRCNSKSTFTRRLNLVLLLCFLPLATLGGNLHGFVHAFGCGHGHSALEDVLSRFDASNRLLENVFSSLEATWEDVSTPGRNGDGGLALTNGQQELSGSDVPTDIPSDQPSVPVTGSRLAIRNTPGPTEKGVYSKARPTELVLADHPSRAGPDLDQPTYVCDGDCQLGLSLRQVQVFGQADVSFEFLHLTANHVEFGAVLRSRQESSHLSIRGPPATTVLS